MVSINSINNVSRNLYSTKSTTEEKETEELSENKESQSTDRSKNAEKKEAQVSVNNAEVSNSSGDTTVESGIENVEALISKIEKSNDPTERESLIEQATKALQELKTKKEETEKVSQEKQEEKNILENNKEATALKIDEIAANNGKGKGLGKNNRYLHLAEKISNGKKLANGHIKQLERLAAGNNEEMKSVLISALEERLNKSMNNDPGYKALDILAANNRINMQVPPVQQLQKAAPTREEAIPTTPLSTTPVEDALKTSESGSDFTDALLKSSDANIKDLHDLRKAI